MKAFPFVPIRIGPRWPWKFDARDPNGHDTGDEDHGEIAQRRHLQRELLWWHHVGPGLDSDPDLSI